MVAQKEYRKILRHMTVEQLEKVFEEYEEVPYDMAYEGKYAGLECILHPFYGWRKGTPCIRIEQWLSDHGVKDARDCASVGIVAPD